MTITAVCSTDERETDTDGTAAKLRQPTSDLWKGQYRYTNYRILFSCAQRNHAFDDHTKQAEPTTVPETLNTSLVARRDVGLRVRHDWRLCGNLRLVGQDVGKSDRNERLGGEDVRETQSGCGKLLALVLDIDSGELTRSTVLDGVDGESVSKCVVQHALVGVVDGAAGQDRSASRLDLDIGDANVPSIKERA